MYMEWEQVRRRSSSVMFQEDSARVYEQDIIVESEKEDVNLN